MIVEAIARVKSAAPPFCNNLDHPPKIIYLDGRSAVPPLKNKKAKWIQKSCVNGALRWVINITEQGFEVVTKEKTG